MVLDEKVAEVEAESEDERNEADYENVRKRPKKTASQINPLTRKKIKPTIPSLLSQAFHRKDFCDPVFAIIMGQNMESHHKDNDPS